jgi:dynein heavy chain, axonemal
MTCLTFQDAALEKRLRHIVDALTYDVFCYTCLGLFERHKLLFSFHVATRIGLAGGLLDQQLLDFFLKGSQSLKASARPKPHAWLSSQVHTYLGTLHGCTDPSHLFRCVENHQ